MAARTKARKRALDVLFQADLREVDPLVALDEFEAQSDGPMNPYTRELVVGVTTQKTRIDDLLATYSADWPLQRMPAVDRNLLRIGVWELLWADDVPSGVAISEAVALSKDLSTDRSPGFVNGVLGQIDDIKDHLVLEP
ncbi:MAG: transcription antitermination factor NusB [Candidatus Nanopelagicales bacterium]